VPDFGTLLFGSWIGNFGFPQNCLAILRDNLGSRLSVEALAEEEPNFQTYEV